MLLTTFSSFAEVGDQISFTSNVHGSIRQFKAGDYIGACCQPGVDAASSGQATITEKYNNNQYVAKIAYYYGYRQDWIHSYDPAPGFENFSNAGALMSMLQAYNVGFDNWISYARNNGFSENSIQYVIDKYQAIESMTINVPDDFVVYKCAPSDNSQDFIVWGFEDVVRGKLKLKKVSNNTSITG